MPKTLDLYLSFVVSTSMKEVSKATRFQRQLTEDECVAAIADKLVAAVPAAMAGAFEKVSTGMAQYVFEAFEKHSGGQAPHFSLVVGYLQTAVGLGWLNAYSADNLKGRYKFYRSSAEMEEARRADLRARSKERRAKFIGGAPPTRRERQVMH